MALVRRAIGGVLTVALAAGVVVSGVVVWAGPAAAAEKDEPIVVNGVVRDNVDNTHSPKMTAQLERQRTGTPRAASADDVQGIDVSRHQHPAEKPIDWSQVAGAGYRSAGIKATEGDYYQNHWYAADRKGASAAGMYTYAYHFATPNDSGGAAQADYFLDFADYRQDGSTLPPVLDVEANPYDGGYCYGLTQAQMVDWIRDFLDQVKRRTGVDAMIYTAASWWRDCTGGSTAFAANPLWVASYNTTPTMPAGWPDYAIWQYSNQGSVPGIDALTDLNYIRGGEATLERLAAESAAPSGYTASDPARVLDTRNAVGVGTRTPLGAGGTVGLDLSAQLPATATAAVLNVTAITTGATYITVWPGGTPRPAVSNLNLGANEVRPNLVTVQLGADRKVQLFNSTGSTHLLADLAGWYAADAPGGYTALSPQRVLDTRPSGAVGANTSRTLNLSSAVPADATAVTLNLTAVGATAGTYLTVWPTGQARPVTSNLNVATADPTPNLVTVKLGTNRSVDLYNYTGTVNLLADLAGYYTPTTGAKFVAVAPRRILDTRTDPVTWVAATGGGTAVTLDTYGRPGTTGTVLNLTGVTPSTGTYVSVYQKTSTTPVRPASSNLNLPAGQVASNLVSTAVSASSEVWLYNSAGTIGLIADLAGYFVP